MLMKLRARVHSHSYVRDTPAVMEPECSPHSIRKQAFPPSLTSIMKRQMEATRNSNSLSTVTSVASPMLSCGV